MRTIGWRRFGWYVWDQDPALCGDWHGRFAPSFKFLFHFNRSARRPNKIIEKKPENIVVKDQGTLRKPDGSFSHVSSPQSGLHTHKIPDSVIRVSRHKARGIECQHPAVFPVVLPAHIIASYTAIDQIVYEPFAGSGTTMLAAESLGRTCYAMELNPKYCDLIVERCTHDDTALHLEDKPAQGEDGTETQSRRAP